MDQEILRTLLVDQLQDIYHAEQQLVKALPKLEKAAQSEELKECLRDHLAETQEQVKRLEQVFEIVGEPAKAKTCKAMQGLVEEGSEATKEEEGELRDLAIIAGAQRVEHYEISAYGTAKAIASRLGLEEAVELLEQTEEEEAAADEKLTEVAETIYGSEDEEIDEDEEDDEDDEESEDEEDDAETEALADEDETSDEQVSVGEEEQTRKPAAKTATKGVAKKAARGGR